MDTSDSNQPRRSRFDPDRNAPRLRWQEGPDPTGDPAWQRAADQLQQALETHHRREAHDASLDIEKPRRLRLGRRSSHQPQRPPAIGHPIEGPTDPRWVLAVRTAERLQGTVLAPEDRENLLRLGKLLGLRPFACNLVIAIVQDQARRGYAPAHCPTAGERELRLIALPEPSCPAPLRTALRTAIWMVTILALEILLLRWWLF